MILFLVGLVLGSFLTAYVGMKTFREGLNKRVGELIKKIMASQGVGDKKKTVTKKKVVKKTEEKK